ncbi:MAG: Flp family type IVb pilin [Patescibacteria group bacterium]|jgi:Flp pilus assembly pilin Flp
MERFVAFLKDETAATVAEYALLAALISIAAIVAMSVVGSQQLAPVVPTTN